MNSPPMDTAFHRWTVHITGLPSLVLAKDSGVVAEAARTLTGRPFVSRASDAADSTAYDAGYVAGRHMETTAGFKRVAP